MTITPGAAIAGGLTATAVLLALGPSTRLLVRWRLGTASRSGGGGSRWRRPRLVGGTLGTLAVGGTAVVVLAGQPHLVLLTVAAGVIAAAVVTLRSRARDAAQRHRRRKDVIDLCDALVAELSAGVPPANALAGVATDWPVVAPAAAIARLGGAVPDALRAAGDIPGAEHLTQVAAVWEVSQRCGAPLMGVLDRLAGTLRDDDEARQEVVSSLAASRATARLLAVLPVFGLLLGGGLGGRPWMVLIDSMIGAGCLLGGAVLAVAGVFWVERIADHAEAT